jgi:hypothetical protein
LREITILGLYYSIKILGDLGLNLLLGETRIIQRTSVWGKKISGNPHPRDEHLFKSWVFPCINL